MIKTLSKAQKMEREKFRIPRSVQDAIPIRRIFADGIFQVGNQYSKTWSFTDINYAIAGKEDKTSMFLDYSELLNALDSGASAKITIYNRRINKAEFERSVLLPDRDDGLDEYRHEFNRMLTAQVTGTSNSIVRERYLTVSVVKRNADEARSYFARVGTDLVTHLAQLFSVAQELTLTERLHIFRDFFKAGEQAAAEFNIHEHSKRGQHFKDWFCPDSMEFAADHFKLDARYGRVLYLQDYASYIKDSFVSELCDLDRDLMLSIDILPVPTDEAARQLQSTLLGVETNVANWQRRQNANNNFTATVPYDMELQRKETKEMLDDLTTRDQRMMFGLVTLVHLADSKEQLDSDTETLYSTARRHLCQLSTLRWQQKDGLDTVLPYGLRKIQALRTLTTESTAVLIPFRAQEIMQSNGLYYGQNAVSKNMIVADRRLLLNGNSFRLGVSGSGKSMSAKEEIVQIALSTEDDILILDPESEFGYLTEALGGVVIRISATSDSKAIEGYEIGAYRYIVKPIIKEKMYAVLDEAISSIRSNYRVILVKDMYNTVVVKIQQILYIYSNARKRCLVTLDGEIETWEQLKSIYEKLPQEQFAYAQKGFVVNYKMIKKLNKTGVELVNGENVPISRGMKNEFFANYFEFLGK